MGVIIGVALIPYKITVSQRHGVVRQCIELARCKQETPRLSLMNDDQMFCEFIFLIFHEQRIQDIKLLYNRCTVQRAFSLEITTSANSLTEWLYYLC
jgi:hypothetical protein